MKSILSMDYLQLKEDSLTKLFESKSRLSRISIIISMNKIIQVLTFNLICGPY